MHIFQEHSVSGESHHNSLPPYFSALYFFCFKSLTATKIIVFGCQVIRPMAMVHAMEPDRTFGPTLT